jgi:hypothetical protein
MADGSVRGEIAAALRAKDSPTYWDWRKGYLDDEAIAEVLTPVVERLQRQAAAKAEDLRQRAPRFWSRVAVGHPRACWPFDGPTLEYGHGRYDSPAGGTAHRMAWALAHGELPPADMVVRHACDNPPCCNPAHLILGTQAENHRDMVVRGRAGYSDQVCKAGHPRTPENTSVRVDARCGVTRRCLTCERAATINRRKVRIPCPRCPARLYMDNLVRHLLKMHGEVADRAALRDRAAGIEAT